MGNPAFQLVDEAYPYLARRLLTDPSPRLRGALRYLLYGRSDVLDAGAPRCLKRDRGLTRTQGVGGRRRRVTGVLTSAHNAGLRQPTSDAGCRGTTRRLRFAPPPGACGASAVPPPSAGLDAQWPSGRPARVCMHADRLIDLLTALEDYHVASTSAMGDAGTAATATSPSPSPSQPLGPSPASPPPPGVTAGGAWPQLSFPFPPVAALPFPFPSSSSLPLPAPAAAMLGVSPVGQLLAGSLGALAVGGAWAPAGGGGAWPGGASGLVGSLAPFAAAMTGGAAAAFPAGSGGVGAAGGLVGAALAPGAGGGVGGGGAREALRFMLSPEGERGPRVEGAHGT